ncbi:MAG: hypothetical protein KA168_00415 [Chitinophagales bacterium]|nr:hypothetical protein [Chitinophagales bacterium]
MFTFLYHSKYFFISLLTWCIVIQLGCLNRKTSTQDLSKGTKLLYIEYDGMSIVPPYGDVVLFDLATKQKTQITYDSFEDENPFFCKSRNTIIFQSSRSDDRYYRHTGSSGPSRLYEYNLETQKITKLPHQLDFLSDTDHRGEKYGAIKNLTMSSYNDSLIAFTYVEDRDHNATVANIVSGEKILTLTKPFLSGFSVLTKNYLLIEAFAMGQVLSVNLNSQKVDTIPCPCSQRQLMNVKNVKENTVYFVVLEDAIYTIYEYNIETQKYTTVKQFSQTDFKFKIFLPSFIYAFNDSTYLLKSSAFEHNQDVFLYHSDSKKIEKLTDDNKHKGDIQVIKNE